LIHPAVLDSSLGTLDIQEDNILLALSDRTELEEIEQGEIEDPCPRKIYKDHTIYSSRLVAIAGTAPVLCDFGEARFGETSYAEHAMPDLYRPPEILLGLAWDEKIDIWGLGLVVSTLIAYL
jgi:serine/threonine protein kinase